jgi:hypothetical protein
LNTPFLAFRSRKAKSLGEISYGDEWIRQGVYAVQAFPLPENCLGVTIENVTDRKLAERAVRESEQRRNAFLNSAALEP